MQRRLTFSRFALPSIALAAFVTFSPATHAQSTKDRLGTLEDQVNQLNDSMRHMQSTLDSRLGVIQHLVEQNTDAVNQMNQAVTAMQQKLNAQGEGTGGKIDSLSGQIQSLNDSLDELKNRIGKIDKQLQDMQSGMQNMQSQPAGGNNSAPPPSGFAGDQSVPPGQQAPPQQQPQNGPGGGMAMNQGGGQAPPLQDTYQSALRDYNAAHFDVAAGEFNDVIHYYPNDPLTGNAQFYLGEIAYKQQKYRDAVKAYNVVLENYGGSTKAPAAQLHKGFSLLQLSQREPGVHELRSLIQRYPQTPEAVQARSRLNALGVRINATK